MRTTGASLFAIAIFIAIGCGARSPLPFPSEGDGADAGAQVPCIPGRFVLQKATPAVMFVLDRSTSMRQPFETGQGSRWRVLTDALATVLPSVDRTMQIGGFLYPNAGAGRDSCPVPGAPEVTLGFGNVAPLVERMRQSSPSGATPTADALERASQSVLSFRAATSARALVLATDGAPNCNRALDRNACRCASGGGSCPTSTRCLDDVRTVERIRAYAARGLPTYVIGLRGAGSEQFDDVLDAMAVAGGRPQPGARRYYGASSAAELERALVAIREQVASCTFLSTSVPSASGSITVSLGGTELPYDEGGASGWTWGNKGNGEIVLLPNVCERAAASPTGSLVATVSCEEESPDAGRDAR